MENQILSASQQAIYLVVIVSAPPILAALVVGLGLATVQALTQIQEQTIQVAAKILAVFTTLYLFGTWMAGNLGRFGRVVFENFGDWVG